MIVRFHPAAIVELREAAEFYAERDPLVGARFIEAVEDAMRRVRESPTRWRVLEDDVRRCLTHVFPYGVLYTIEPDGVLIVAVMHCGREPGYWRGRVQDR